MRSFRDGYDGKGGKDKNGHDVGDSERLVGKVLEKKSSPYAGMTRLLVKGKNDEKVLRSVDIDMKLAKDIKEKDQLIMNVRERDDSKNPGFQRKKSASFKAYSCEEKPETYESGSEYKEAFTRFGSSSSSKNNGRLKF